jgi:hypothetical protein
MITRIFTKNHTKNFINAVSCKVNFIKMPDVYDFNALCLHTSNLMNKVTTFCLLTAHVKAVMMK